MPREINRGEGEKCQKRYLLRTIYADRFGLPPHESCPPRQRENDWSSWTHATCCDLDDCPAERAASSGKPTKKYMKEAMKMAQQGMEIIDENTVKAK